MNDISNQNAETRIKQLEESLFEKNEELDKARRQLGEEKQRSLDLEKKWRSQLESERQDFVIKFDGQVKFGVFFFEFRFQLFIYQLVFLVKLVQW